MLEKIPVVNGVVCRGLNPRATAGADALPRLVLRSAVTVGTLRKIEFCVSVLTTNRGREKGSLEMGLYGASRLLLWFCFGLSAADLFLQYEQSVAH